MRDPTPIATFPPTPLQQGMLFEHLSGGRPGVDVEQIVVDFDDEPDVPRLGEALALLVARHDALRSAFRWEDTESPVQEIRSDVEVPIADEALEARAEEDGETLFREWLRRDRARGFDPGTAPLLRAALLRPGRARASLVLTFHHLVMDGRSMPQACSELFAIYDALAEGRNPELAPARSCREHADFLASRAAGADESFWRPILEGLSGPTEPALAASAATRRAGAHAEPGDRDEHVLRLSRATTASLRELARKGGFSLATIVQGAWALLLSRTSREEDVVFGCVRACRRSSVPGADGIVGVFINTLPLRVSVDPRARLLPWLSALGESQRRIGAHEHASLASIQRWSGLPAGTRLFESILVYDHHGLNTQVHGDPERARKAARRFELFEQTGYPLTLYAYGEPELFLKLAWDADYLPREDALRLGHYLETLLEGFVSGHGGALGEIPMVTGEERETLLGGFNATRLAYRRDATVPDQFEQQVARTPEARALVCEKESLSYGELDARANALARVLQELGVGSEIPVGLCLERSLDLVVALLAVGKAGGAYLPLDPAYPRERLAFMIGDAGVRVLLTQRRLAGTVPPGSARLVFVDELPPPASPESAPRRDIGPRSLAYVLYTSGSTGTPKGVMVEQRNLINFFAGMDERLGPGPGTWLAVTSLSFDISALELLWTLTRGFEVVLYSGRDRPGRNATEAVLSKRPLAFSLFYFASDEGGNPQEKYRLLLEGARFADERGFEAVWTPERHFHAFGGLYPNPSVTSAALAAITRRVSIRAGSVVLPLHDPVRVAEEWSLVDNLSNGRVGISFASGWQPIDFVLAPENYAARKEILERGIDTVRRLWRGESIARRAPDGSMQEIRTLPRPVQTDLPVWVTTAGSVETWRQAGELGANVLTHLLGQTVEELAQKIAVYREARARGGHAGEGRVTLMLHTFVGEDDEEVRALVRGPMIDYLRSSVGLIRNFVSSFPTFKDRAGALEQGDFERLGPEEMNALLEHAFQRYFETSGLFGTPRACLATIARIQAVGVDEIACLIDFGVPAEAVLRHLEDLDELRRRVERAADAATSRVPDLLRRHRVTHLQCTPSMASLLLAEDGAEEALGELDTLLLGGEALPGPLAEKLERLVRGRVINMYGPTETTIWSSTHDVVETGEIEPTIPIGRPIANTQFYVLAPGGGLAPIGLPGELYIGGDGVARGYLNRPELTAERFVSSPLATGDSPRLYRTGDLARVRPDGVFEFLGRTDRQVKLRGYRIELDEIEACLRRIPRVREAVAVVREDRPGERTLVAYAVARKGQTLDGHEIRAELLERLPEFMVPAHVVELEALPLTPNAKIDHKALPAPEVARAAEKRDLAPPANELEHRIADIWKEVLAVPKVGRDDNFFDLGGHSLLTIQVQGRLRRTMNRKVPITDLFRFPTVRTLAEFLTGGAAPQAEESSHRRVQARVEGRDRALRMRERRVRARGTAQPGSPASP